MIDKKTVVGCFCSIGKNRNIRLSLFVVDFGEGATK